MSEQRLPLINGDGGKWGIILNQFLSKEHYNTGLDNIANGSHKTITLRPGTTVAGTAPLKFSSGDLLTTPEPGTIEYLTDTFYLRGTDKLNVTNSITAGTINSGSLTTGTIHSGQNIITNTDSIGPVTFSGTGVNNMTVSGADHSFNGGTYNIFAGLWLGNWYIGWTKDDGSNFFVQGIPLTTSPIAIKDGIYVTFATTTGHVNGDNWTFTTTPASPLLINDHAGGNLITVNNNGQIVAPDIISGTAGTPDANGSVNPLIVFIGDSLTVGYLGNHPYNYYLTMPTYGTADSASLSFDQINLGMTSETLQYIYKFAPSTIYPLYRYNSGMNIAVVWSGTNDIYEGSQPLSLVPTTFSYLQRFCSHLKEKGWRVIVMTMISRGGTGMDTAKNYYNSLIRTHYLEFADGMADLGANAHLGTDGAYSNRTYFQADDTHLTDAGYSLVGSILNPIVNNLVNIGSSGTYIGNDYVTQRNFSSTTYLLNDINYPNAITATGRLQFNSTTTPDLSSNAALSVDMGTSIRPAGIEAQFYANPSILSNYTIIGLRGGVNFDGVNWGKDSEVRALSLSNKLTGQTAGNNYLDIIGAKITGNTSTWSTTTARTLVGLDVQGFSSDSNNSTAIASLFSAGLKIKNDGLAGYGNTYPNQFGLYTEKPTRGVSNWQSYLLGIGTGTGQFFGGTAFDTNLITANANSTLTTLGNWSQSGTNWIPSGPITALTQASAGSGYGDVAATVSITQTGGSGAIIGLTGVNCGVNYVINGGTGYSLGTNLPTTIITGAGTGKTLNITAMTYARHTAGSVNPLTLSHTYLTAGSILNGKKYIIIYEIIAPTSGSFAGTLTPKLGTVVGNVISAAGSYSTQIIAGADDADLSFNPSTDFNGAIQNVSIYCISAWNYSRVFADAASNLSLAINVNGTEKTKIQVVGDTAINLSNVVFPVQAPTTSAPTYVKGGVYFDTTLNKLRVGGATGWETITSV